MYFVSSGLVEVVSSSGDILSLLGPSSFFGEMALLNPDGRAVASIRVKSYCEGYRLTREAYSKLVFAHPSLQDYLESVAKMRLRAKQGKQNKELGKDADLATIFENLNPTKRECTAHGTHERLKDSTPSHFTRSPSHPLTLTAHTSPFSCHHNYNRQAHTERDQKGEEEHRGRRQERRRLLRGRCWRQARLREQSGNREWWRREWRREWRGGGEGGARRSPLRREPRRGAEASDE